MSDLSFAPDLDTRAARRESLRTPLRAKIQFSAVAIAFLSILVAALGLIVLKGKDEIPVGTLNTNHVTEQFQVTNETGARVDALTADDPQEVAAIRAIGLRLVCERTQLAPGESTTCGPGARADNGVLVRLADVVDESTTERTWFVVGISGIALSVLLVILASLRVFDPKRVVVHSVRSPEGTRVWGSA